MKLEVPNHFVPTIRAIMSAYPKYVTIRQLYEGNEAAFKREGVNQSGIREYLETLANLQILVVL